jgi:hypothetical protein
MRWRIEMAKAPVLPVPIHPKTRISSNDPPSKQAAMLGVMWLRSARYR